MLLVPKKNRRRGIFNNLRLPVGTQKKCFHIINISYPQNNTVRKFLYESLAGSVISDQQHNRDPFQLLLRTCFSSRKPCKSFQKWTEGL